MGEQLERSGQQPLLGGWELTVIQKITSGFPVFVVDSNNTSEHFALPREGMRLDFRTEFFNLFNHPQWGTPGGNLSGADFNSPATFTTINYTVNNPRLIQFALKLAF
jgi:hypothetical protein